MQTVNYFQTQSRAQANYTCDISWTLNHPSIIFILSIGYFDQGELYNTFIRKNSIIDLDERIFQMTDHKDTSEALKQLWVVVVNKGEYLKSAVI